MRPLVRQFALTSHQERSAAGSGSCFRCAAGGFVRLVAWCWLAGSMQRRRQQMELFPAWPHQSPEENATAAAQPEPVNLSTWQLHQVEHRPPCPAIQDGSSYTRKKAGRRSLDNRRGCRICLPWCSRPDGRTADTTPGLFRYRRKYTRNGRHATGSSTPGTAAADNQPGPVAGFLDPMKHQGDHYRSSSRQTIPDCIAGSFHTAPVLLTRQATTGPG